METRCVYFRYFEVLTQWVGQGRGEEVPANAALVYDIELVTINGRTAAITSEELERYKAFLFDAPKDADGLFWFEGDMRQVG